MKFERKCLAALTKTGKGEYGIGAPAVAYSADLLTYLRITDINDDGTLNKEGLKSVADTEASKYLLQPNDIVFARTGASTGRNYFYDGNDGPLVYAGFLIKFSIDETKVNPKFIKYYCRSQQYKSWINSFSTGSTRGNINAQTLGAMEIDLPPRQQQDKLVSIASSIDNKIAINNAINNNLQQQGIAIVENYLTTTENEILLGDIMSFDNGFAFQSNTYQQNGTYRVITIKNVQDGYIDSNDASYISYIPPKMKSCCVLREGDALLSLTGNVGRVGIVYEPNLLLNQRVAKVVPFEKSLQGFVYFLLRHPVMKSRMETIAKGTAQQNLSPIETLKLPIAFCFDTVSAITLQLNSFYTQLVALFVENKQLATLRDTLLPKLMSGEIDVSDIEI